jgi:hypothetical protein
LFLDNMTDAAIHRLGELRFVHRLSFLAPDKQFRQLVIAWKTTDMSHENPIPAGKH